MLDAKQIQLILKDSLSPVEIPAISFKSQPVQSSLLISSKNGAFLCYATSENQIGLESDSHFLNNLKMMSLLIKDKWSEDQQQQTASTDPQYAYNCTIPDKDTTLKVTIYTYKIEELHAVVAQIPDSDLLFLLIADKNFSYGLLVQKIKQYLHQFQSLYHYKFD